MWTPSRLALVTVLATAISAGATLGPTEQRCQDAIAKAGRKLLARQAAILGKCQRRVLAGRLPPATDCLTDPATSASRAHAAALALEPVLRACSDADVASLAPAGDCRGAVTLADLATCLEASHGARAEAFAAVTGGAGGALSSHTRPCRTRAGKQAWRYARTRLRLVQKCKHRPEAYDLLPGSACVDSPRLAKSLARLETKTTAKIAAACDAAALGEAPFGGPCDAAADGGALAVCLLAEARTAADGALAAEFPDPGFCGETGDAVEVRVGSLVALTPLADEIAQMHGDGTIAGGWRTAGYAPLGVPGLGMLDGPRGASTLAGNATAFPVGMARAATWDPALEERVGEAIGEEVRAKGASVLLAPTINMLRHPRWGRAQETYGEDTVLIGRMATGFVLGAQRHVIANPKHFAANSIEDTRFTVDVSLDERTLREVYLPHFRAAVQDGHAASVMSAYNRVNGHFCAENAHLLHDVLKGDWGFQGFVESDWILGTRSTVPSIEAGLDVEMPTGVYYGQALLDAVTGGTVPRALVDDALRRILRTELCFRLDTDPPVADPSKIESPAHVELAHEAARESLVLLKNGAGALPLDRTRVGSVAVVGPLAAVANMGDTGSSNVAPTTAVSPLDGLLAHAGGVTITPVPGPVLSAGDQAAIAAADAVVVVVGLTADDEGEGLVGAGDRQSLVLPGGQDQLVADVAALNARTIVVLEGSGPVTMPWLADVGAVVMAWYPGQEGGHAIAEVLFGDANPSGRLPVSFPVAEGDLPPFDNTSPGVTYGYYHGYRWLDRNGTTPLFPFGFGLSYTTFQLANLTVSPQALSPWGRLRATVEVTNTGTVAGDEVVQLYIGYPASAVDRAVRDLKAFARVHLEPGETRIVPLEVRVADLAYWDAGTSAWVIEPTTYDVEVGSSSGDLPLQASVTVVP